MIQNECCKIVGIEHRSGMFILTLDGGDTLTYSYGSNGYRWYYAGFISKDRIEEILGLPAGSISNLEAILRGIIYAEKEIERDRQDVVKSVADECFEIRRSILGRRHARLKTWREQNPHSGIVPESLRAIRNIQHYGTDGDEPGYVYFLLSKGVVVYVGQTSDAWPTRVMTHMKEGIKVFDDVWFLKVDPASLLEVESTYIRRFKPLYNLAGKPVEEMTA